MQNEFNSSMENETDSSGAFETIMINALQVPGVKVNRNKFLYWWDMILRKKVYPLITT